MDLVRTWWEWCTESFGHMFLGVTAPILLIAAFVILVSAGDGDLPMPPRTDIAGVCLHATPSAGDAACAGSDAANASGALLIDTATPVPATPTPPPRNYTVQPGDALSVICAAEAPDMEVETCIAETVSLSELGGPDEIVAGQTIRLPGTATSGASDSPRPTPTPAPELTQEPDEESIQEPEEEAEPAVEAPEAADGEGEPEEVAVEDAPETDGDPEPGPETTPAASLVPMLQPLDVDPEAPLPEDYDIDDAWLYVVQPGESILGICGEQVPDMPADECARYVVVLNELDGPDEIYAHQGLLLP